jgi:1,4-dihydroxy-2-naphthoate octaprenyltransferase
VIGVVSAHISVNLFNEYSDYHTKIDFSTNRTPFSGGSGMLPAGQNTPKQVLTAAIITLLISSAIGIYFTIIAHWSILVISAIGAFSIVFYTDHLAKMMLGELFAGLALGSLVVLGTYIAMTASPSNPFVLPSEVSWLSVPPGILTGLLLFINEFPDAEADLAGGRKHLVIRLGKKRAAWLYSAGMIATFAIIVILPVTGLSSFWIYLALFPVPFAVKASMTALKSGDNYAKMVGALGSNVVTVLLTDLLLAVAIFIEVL